MNEFKLTKNGIKWHGEIILSFEENCMKFCTSTI